MAKPKYNSPEEYAVAVVQEEMSKKSLQQLKHYYKRKGNADRVKMIEEAFSILKEAEQAMEYIGCQEDGQDLVGFRD